MNLSDKVAVSGEELHINGNVIDSENWCIEMHTDRVLRYLFVKFENEEQELAALSALRELGQQGWNIETEHSKIHRREMYLVDKRMCEEVKVALT